VTGKEGLANIGGWVAMKTAVKYFLYGVGFVLLLFAALIVYGDYQKKVQKPAIPVQVQYRKAILNPSLVARFTNRSNRNLAFLATFENPTLNEVKKFEISLNAGVFRDIGHLEGWAFHSGDKITLHHADYSDERVTLP